MTATTIPLKVQNLEWLVENGYLDDDSLEITITENVIEYPKSATVDIKNKEISKLHELVDNWL